MRRTKRLKAYFWKISLVCLLALAIFDPSLQAQPSPRILTLEEAIDIALEKSYSMRLLQLNLTQARENLKAAKGRFKTNAQLSLQTPNFTEQVSEVPVANSLPVFNTTGTLRFQGSLDINQPLPTDGKFTLRSFLYRRDVSTFLGSGNRDIKRNDFYTSISLQFQQPLFTINKLKLGLKTAELNFEKANRRFKRAELDIVYNVAQAFYNLYRATREVEIATEEVGQQEKSYDLAKKKYQAGLIPEVEALQMEVDLASSRNSLLVAQGNLQRQKDSFKQLIGLDLEEDIGVQTDFRFQPVKIDINQAIAEGLKNRSEIREREIERELAQMQVKEVDSKSEVRGDLYAFYDLTGVSDPNLPWQTGLRELFQSSWDDLQRRPKNRGVVFTLSVPLWDWGVNAAEVAQARANLRASELELTEEKKTIVREIRDAVGQVQEAENRLQVLKKTEDLAQRSYDISLERFNNGDITSQELALAQTRLTSAKTSYLDAFIAYQLALADLKRKTIWDFEKGISLVE